MATGDETILQSLRRPCVPGALVEIIIGLDPKRDQAEIEALALPILTKKFLAMSLIPRYEARGFEVLEQEVLGPSEWPTPRTTWAKPLQVAPGEC